MVAKLIVFARARISGVTSSWGTPKMIAAVWRWMSPPCSNAWTNAGSPEVREQPQLDLGVDRGDEHGAGGGDERPPDRFAARRAHGDVLEVRLRGGQPAGGGAGLVETRMDAARCRIDEPGQRVDVGRLELGELAVLDQESGNLVAHRCQLLEDVVIGRRAGLRPLEDRELVLLEQDVPELGGGVDVELGARDAVDRLLELRQLVRERPRDLAEALEIYQHPVPLHLDEHGDERHLDEIGRAHV